MSDATVTLTELGLYPIKGCGGIAPREALLVETGLEFDRAWMAVDADTNVFVTQRQLPRMALVQPTLRVDDLMLRAPGMLALHVQLDAVETATRATVWDDEVAAYDMGALCAQWFSDFLGRPLRLVRFDPEQKRLSDKRWSGPVDAENAFADGFPLLVASTGGLAEFNRRLAAAGHDMVTMERFRPNLVLDGLEAHGEDALDEIVFDNVNGDASGTVKLKLVKPCGRCSIPDVNPSTGEPGHAVGDTLASYRADARLEGALTFGMNAVIVEGIERALRAGMQGRANYRFD